MISVGDQFAEIELRADRLIDTETLALDGGSYGVTDELDFNVIERMAPISTRPG